MPEKATATSEHQLTIALNALFEKFDKDWARFAVCFGLSTTELDIMWFMADSKDEPTQKQVSEQLGYSKQIVNIAVKTLMKKGFLALEESKEDRRHKIIRLTPEGSGLAHRIESASDKLDRRCIEALDAEERKALLRGARKYVDAFAMGVDELEKGV